jgi:hypothetical protein
MSAEWYSARLVHLEGWSAVRVLQMRHHGTQFNTTKAMLLAAGLTMLIKNRPRIAQAASLFSNHAV